MAKKISLGPDPQCSFSYQELPIGSTMGIDPEVVKTGTWRFYRPFFVWGTAPCREACPAGVDVRGFISHVRKKNFEQAWLRYMEENPFPAICGRICPYPCEGACNRKDLDSPVSIRTLERFISDFDKPLATVSDPDREKRQICIVGGGPTGLSCAFFLTRLGYRPTLIERENQIGGKLKRVSKYDLPGEVIDREIKAIVKQGVTVKQCEWHWGDLEKYEAVFLAIGLTDRKSVEPSSLTISMDGGKIRVDAGCATNRKGLFAGGEAAQGVQSVVETIRDGKRGAMAIDYYLHGKNFSGDLKRFSIGEKGEASFECYRAGLKDGLERVVRYPDLNLRLFPRKTRVEVLRQSMEIEEEKSIEIELTINSGNAIEEASRCLVCGSCNRCGLCLLYCPEGAISHGSSLTEGMKINYDFCKGCGICRNECPRGMYAFKKEEADWE